MGLFGGEGGGGDKWSNHLGLWRAMHVVVRQITSGTPLKHSTSLSAMFVYIQVPSNNPINVRAPSLGPRLSPFSEVSYWVNYDPLRPSK